MRTQDAALDRVDTKALAPAVYCTGRRPDAAGGWARACEGGTSAQRKGGCCYWVPVMWPKGLCNFWDGVPPPLRGLRRRPPPSRHVPLAHPAEGGDVRRSGPVHGPSRPRSVSVVGWVTAPARPRSRQTRRLGRVTRPGARPRAAGRAQPSHHGAWKVGGARALRGSALPRDPRRKATSPYTTRDFLTV